MNKFSVINTAVILVCAGIGSGWLWFLSWLCAGQGLVHMQPPIMILDLIVVALLSIVAVASNRNIALLALGGWVLGQFALLTWDAIPHGRSPQPFEPVGFGENLIFNLLALVILNWPALPGTLIGYILRCAFKRKTPAKIK